MRKSFFLLIVIGLFSTLAWVPDLWSFDDPLPFLQKGIELFYEGKFEEAIPYLKKGLEIFEKSPDKKEPEIGMALTILGNLYRATGRYTEAEPLFKRALEIMEKILGKEHPDISTLLSNQSTLYAITGRHYDCHSTILRASEIEARKREDIFTLLSDRQKLNYIERSREMIDFFLMHTARFLSGESPPVLNSFNAWLRWKGAVMETQGRYMEALIHSEKPELKRKFEELISVRREVAKLNFSRPEKVDYRVYLQRLGELENRKEALEKELSRMSKEFSLEKRVGKADAEKLSELLLKQGNNPAYLDFARIETYELKELKRIGTRYLVFLLIPGRGPVVRLIDLCEAEEVEKHILAYHEELRWAKEYGEVPRERVLRAEARKLYEILLKPLKPFLEGRRHLYISPDGSLNLIPFEVLVTSEGRYLMEEYEITYVSAGRDIVRFTETEVAKEEALILADPDYDMGLREKVEVAKSLGVVETRSPAPISRDAKGLRFNRLPDTKKEADTIEKILREGPKVKVRNYQDKQAIEDVLFSVKSPRILHLATHGYFLKDEEVRRSLLTIETISLERAMFVDILRENPMVRSGIVLAGANASLKEGRDDGVVSAEKILGLRLRGTDLVVLSACDTGLGEVRNGEGVFGLKRAFILSGAKTVVMSLWSVPSQETTELMIDFYRSMAKGKKKSEALKEARMNLMKKKPNPFYWGAFILVGSPN
ncbi:MAG: CHAT domain-containing protein [Desulfobacterota bacterium]|nr:CHAT domain-containing protein [Thermodesulfobacteriota bacterium]